MGQGLAFLRKSHGGCNSPPDCCQEPPFESILAQLPLALDRPGLDSYSSLLQKWWAKMDSNHRPHDYQSCALASWAIGPRQNQIHNLRIWLIPIQMLFCVFVSPLPIKPASLGFAGGPGSSSLLRYILSIPCKLNNAQISWTSFWP